MKSIIHVISITLLLLTMSCSDDKKHNIAPTTTQLTPQPRAGSREFVYNFNTNVLTQIEIETYIEALSSKNITNITYAQMTLAHQGETILPFLIKEMNTPEIVDEDGFFEAVKDPLWHKRKRIASVIELITKEDFWVHTTAHGWAPNISFDKINKWWEEKQKTPNQSIEAIVTTPVD